MLIDARRISSLNGAVRSAFNGEDQAIGAEIPETPVNYFR
jgi:hypothetical protein